MNKPKISFLLCTVRGYAYLEHPEWGAIDKVINDLKRQTMPPDEFELVIVDGLYGFRDGAVMFADADFRIVYVPPRDTLATRNHKVAICAYRNTGLIYASGELIVNLDDACELPPRYASTFWSAWEGYRVCLAALWPESGDSRPAGRVETVYDCVTGEPRPSPGVYGFGSYPLETALALNGYDEAYDLSQALEDADWSVRLLQAGTQMALMHIPGFRILPQTPHDPRAIDAQEPIVKCCNAAWQTQRVWRQVQIANEAHLWPEAMLRRLVGPCLFLNSDNTCRHHRGQQRCAYVDDKSFVTQLHPIAAQLYNEPPVVDLRAERRALGRDA